MTSRFHPAAAVLVASLSAALAAHANTPASRATFVDPTQPSEQAIARAKANAASAARRAAATPAPVFTPVPVLPSTNAAAPSAPPAAAPAASATTAPRVPKVVSVVMPVGQPASVLLDTAQTPLRRGEVLPAHAAALAGSQITHIDANGVTVTSSGKARRLRLGLAGTPGVLDVNAAASPFGLNAPRDGAQQ